MCTGVRRVGLSAPGPGRASAGSPAARARTRRAGRCRPAPTRCAAGGEGSRTPGGRSARRGPPARGGAYPRRAGAVGRSGGVVVRFGRAVSRDRTRGPRDPCGGCSVRGADTGATPRAGGGAASQRGRCAPAGGGAAQSRARGSQATRGVAAGTGSRAGFGGALAVSGPDRPQRSSGSTRTSASDRLSPPPRARCRALDTSISLASRAGRVCTMAPSSLGVK